MGDGSQDVLVNPDLDKERRNLPFNPSILTYILDGGIENTRRRRHIVQLVETDPGFDGPDPTFLSREEDFTEMMRKQAHCIRKCKEFGLEGDDRMFYMLVALNSPMPAAINFLTRTAIELMGSEPQKQKWLTLINNSEITCCYCQTELGHGTWVPALETTAVYDADKQEFILHTPTLTATKWWVGRLGKFATHALVMAQLYTTGESRGPHPFMVPLRSLHDHQPLPGVTVGDIGPKLGLNSIDHGYLRLDHVRIPRDNMLVNTGEVQKDGTYVEGGHKKLVYGGMLALRALVPSGQSICLGMAVTIATRYSCVRRQSELRPGEREPQVLDYQTQQDRLFPALASSYAYRFAGTRLYEQSKSGALELPELHALSSGLKALTSSRTGAMIEVCRLACGGHGFSAASGLPQLFGEQVGGVTAEGETTILYLQASRYLLKNYMSAKEGKKLDQSVAYLSTTNFDTDGLTGDIDLGALLKLYQYKSVQLLATAVRHTQKHISDGKDIFQSMLQSMVVIEQAAKAYAEVAVVQAFLDAVQQPVMDPAVRKILQILYKTYTIYGIVQDGGVFLQDNHLQSSHLEALEDSLYGLYAELRPYAVACTDAFEFSDRRLQSILGRHDGMVYENLYKWAKDSPLNKTEVHESYYKYTKPLQDEFKSNL